jgi:hypothetical protein
VLVRIAYFAATHAYAALRLLPMTNREKDIEILALCHQLSVLQRQLGDQPPHLRPEDRAFLAALLVPLFRATLRRFRLLVSPDTVLRWHRDLAKQRHARASMNCGPGRLRTLTSIRRLLPRMQLRTPPGATGASGELALLGITIAPSTVWEILKPMASTRLHTGQPPPGLTSCTLRPRRSWRWASSRPSPSPEHASTFSPPSTTPVGACAFWAPPPTPAWLTQAIRNLLMDLEDAESFAQVRFLIRDRDAMNPALINEILSRAKNTTVLTGVRMPRMNTIAEHWVQTLRAELLDRMLIWNENHLRRALREAEQHHNLHRTHRSLAAAAPASCQNSTPGP